MLITKLRKVPRAFRLAILPTALLTLAAGFSIAQGQPPPANRPSGVTLPASTPQASQTDVTVYVGHVVLAADGKAFRYDLASGHRSLIVLDKGERVVSVKQVLTGYVVFTTNPKKHHNAFFVVDESAPKWLGEATDVVPDRDKKHLWRLAGKVARQITLDGKETGPHVTVPASYYLVGSIKAGLVAASKTDNPLVHQSAKYRTVILRPAKPVTPFIDNTAVALRGESLLVQTNEGLAVYNVATKKNVNLPRLAAIAMTGPVSFSPDGSRFAAVARQGRYERLVVGRLDATSSGEIRVIALSEDSVPPPTPPAWPTDSEVVGFRANGDLVLFTLGGTEGVLLATEPEPSASPTT